MHRIAYNLTKNFIKRAFEVEAQVFRHSLFTLAEDTAPSYKVFQDSKRKSAMYLVGATPHLDYVGFTAGGEASASTTI